MTVRTLRKLVFVLLVIVGLAVAGTAQVGGAPSPLAVKPPAPAIPPPLTPEDINAWLDGMVPDGLNRAEVPGAIVSVVKDGQVITTRGYGYADMATKTPVTGDTVFQVASVSKLPTTVLALQLVEEGKLDLDADIATYVDVPIERSFDDPITLRHLLTHTAGFENRIGMFRTYEPGARYDMTIDVSTDPPKQVYRPGAITSYSNYGLDLVGYIVQQVSGTAFPELAEQSIFRPAGMDSSTFRTPLPADMTERFSGTYITASQPGRGFYTNGSASAGMSTTGHDAAKLMIAQLDDTLLSTESKELAWHRGIESPHGGIHLGLGYFITERNGHKVVGHSGDLEYFRSRMDLYPEENIGVFVSVNSSGVDQRGVELRNAIVQSFADRYLPAPQQDTPISAGAAKRAQEVAGWYTDSRSIESNSLSLVFDTVPLRMARIQAQPNGSLLIDGKVFQESEPWVWRNLDNSMTYAADPTRTNKNLVMAVVTYAPVTAGQWANTVALYSGLVFLLLVLVMWPVGALCKYPALRWRERLARIGALCTFGSVVCIPFMMRDVFAIPRPVIVTMQLLAVAAALALLPAVWSLATTRRTNTGRRRMLTNLLLAVGLALVTVVFATHHFFSLDLSV